jgi:outer membrane lipoprotein-sorting protein
MKKTIIICTLGLFLVSITGVLGCAQTAEEIIQKMIEATGGKEAIESVDDSIVKGTIDLTDAGYSGEITIYKKEPDKMRLDVELMGMVITQAYDGNLAWWTNPQTGATEEMPPTETDSMKRDALPRDAIFNMEKYGITLDYKGKEQIDGKEHYVIDQTYADGFKITIYLDSATYLVTKSKGMIESGAGEVEFEQVASDYKKVKGLMTAHTITTYVNGVESRVIKITEIQYNTGLEDSLFSME